MDVVVGKFGERVVTVYRADAAGVGEKGLPVVYSNDYSESGAAVLARCKELGCSPFHLVTISGFGWDHSMSPWQRDPVVSKDDDFTGEAPEHLAWMLAEAMPCAEVELGVAGATSYIAGYSMAGLFALWALYQTDRFSGAASGSGSLWFPGFEDYALSHRLAGDARGIYLSLGSRETKVRNPTLRRTGDICEKLCEHYQALGVPSTFETNPGNHFKDTDLRMAKAITWLLETAG